MTSTLQPTPSGSSGRMRSTQALVAGALVGPVLALAGVLWLRASKAALPGQIAVHWGLDGTPDRYASFTETTVTAALLTALAPLLLVLVGAFLHRSTRGPLAALAGALGVFIGAVSFGSALAQRDGGAPRAFPAAWMAGGLVAAVLVGVVLHRWGRWVPPAVDGPRPPLPADAARVDVTPTTRLAWTGRASLSLVGIAILGALTVLSLAWLATSGEPWVWLIVVGVAALLLVTLSARVVVDTAGLRISSLGLSWSKVPLERVSSASTATVSPLREFGGWGWRIGRDGRRGYVTRAGEALVVHRVGEPDVVVTVDDAAGAAAVLNTLASRA